MKHENNALRPHNNFKNIAPKVAFDKKELGQILRIYGRMVALGEWRDYGIAMLRDFSVFSIYRHASEYPIYRVKKTVRNANKPEIFSVITMDGIILKQGPDLQSVLRSLEVKLIRTVK